MAGEKEVTPYSESLQISDYSFLCEIDTRSSCPSCLKSRKYFCYSCKKPLPITQSRFPHLKLPLKVDIIHHPLECESKSTAVHAAILAPDDVVMYDYPDVPQYDLNKTILLYPGNNSVPLQEFLLEHSSSACHGVTGARRVQDLKHDFDQKKCLERVVLLDSTWYTVNKLLQHPSIAELPRVEIASKPTQFWRHQFNKPTTHLATIEALYFFLRELHDCTSSVPYSGQFDNLMFLFCFIYDIVQGERAKGKIIKAYDMQHKRKAAKS